MHALAFGGFSLVGPPLFAIIKAYLGAIGSHLFVASNLIGVAFACFWCFQHDWGGI